MIAVDTSALMAIALDEPAAEACSQAIEKASGFVISAATLAEALIVATNRGVLLQMHGLIERIGFEVSPVTAATAQRVAEAHQKWGKRRHPAGLNFGDCFSYDTAKTRACPLLYVGEDFRKTDLQSVLV